MMTEVRELRAEISNTYSLLWRELLHPCYSLLLFSGPSPSEKSAALIATIINEFRSPLVRCFMIWHGEVAPSSWQYKSPLLDPRGEAHARYALREPGWYLVRPDQYIAARGLDSELSVLKDYFQKLAPPLARKV
jgi:hypothetical protein